jgi:hypothetical protein
VLKLNELNEDVKFMLEKLLVFSSFYGECMNLICVWLILVDFELDSKLVVDSFRYHRKDFTEFGAIIQHCKVFFSSFSFYVNSSIEFVRRQDK